MAHDLRYGFIGLGQMGWDSRRNEFLELAKPKGPVSVASSPKEVAEQADIIITMLPKAAHVREVYLNENTGLLAAANTDGKTRHYLECSSIEVAASTAVGKAVVASGAATFVDAPVSGGPNGANAGTLTLMVGGSQEDFHFVKPVLQLMGSNVFYCGPAGAGLATKQINNYLSSICTVGVCEAMNMGVKYGLDPKTLAGVINVSSGRCYNSLEQNPVKGVTPGAASEKDFEGGFSVELCKGVLDMAVELGKQVGAQSVLADRVLGLYDKSLTDERTKGRDSRSVYRLFAEDSAL